MGDKFGATLRKITSSLPSASLPSPLETLREYNLIKDSEGNEKPEINVGMAANYINKYLRRTGESYERQRGACERDKLMDQVDEEEEQRMAKMKPVEKWNRLETLWEIVEQKQREVNSGWEIQCR